MPKLLVLHRADCSRSHPSHCTDFLQKANVSLRLPIIISTFYTTEGKQSVQQILRSSQTAYELNATRRASLMTLFKQGLYTVTVTLKPFSAKALSHLIITVLLLSFYSKSAGQNNNARVE